MRILIRHIFFNRKNILFNIYKNNHNRISSNDIYIYTSRKFMRCTGKLLKIKSKLILILFTLFFFSVQNVVGKIDKETLRI